ncbi:MAG: 1-(5-phosphoribosyl)-5-[(5-phosphoribosylamino)methylideneamino]imidazole-4-carboxamide isomerase [Chitinophagaceae bacterium]
MIEIIPAIDIIDGKCVRLTQGDYSQKTVYHENPLEIAIMFESCGIKRLHLVDLDGAKKGSVVNWKTLEKIATSTNLLIDFGGGIKLEDDLKKVLDSGAKWATIGSLAVKSPELFSEWLIKYQPSSFFLGADVRDEKLAVSGWMETTDEDIFSFVDSYVSLGLNYIFCTDISKDGKLDGPSIALYQKLKKHNPNYKLVASGGVSSISDIPALEQAGCNGVIIGKAIYENRISMEDLQKLLV